MDSLKEISLETVTSLHAHNFSGEFVGIDLLSDDDDKQDFLANFGRESVLNLRNWLTEWLGDKESATEAADGGEPEAREFSATVYVDTGGCTEYYEFDGLVDYEAADDFLILKRADGLCHYFSTPRVIGVEVGA